MRKQTGYRKDGWKQVLLPMDVYRAVFVRAGQLQVSEGEDVAAWKAIDHALKASEQTVTAESAQRVTA